MRSRNVHAAVSLLIVFVLPGVLAALDRGEEPVELPADDTLTETYSK